MTTAVIITIIICATLVCISIINTITYSVKERENRRVKNALKRSIERALKEQEDKK